MYYRTREARIEVCNGYTCWHERRFHAERLVRLWFLSWWWPVTDGAWRKTREEALRDVEYDRHLHGELSPPQEVER